MSSILLFAPGRALSVEMAGKLFSVRPVLPWWRSAATVAATSGSSVSTAPASPSAPSVLEGKKDRTPPTPCRPACTPLRRMPIASALSSTTVRPCCRATAVTAAMSAIVWNRCTGITNRLRGVTAAFSAAGSIAYVFGSMSTNCGVPPASTTAEAVAKNEYLKHQDTVAWAQSAGAQQQHQRVRAAVDADHMPGAGVVRERRLELPDLFSVGELAAVENAIQSLFDGWPQSFESRGL